MLYHLIQAAFLFASLASLFYLIFAIERVESFRRRLREPLSPARPPVSLLIPIFGPRYQLYENLSSFCAQDYPPLQIIFGVRDSADTAIPIIERVIAEWPDRDLTLVIDARVHGGNLKVSNLINMFPAARHDLIAIADCDIRAGRHDLARLAGAFADARVGAASGLYAGVSDGRWSSMLGALYINDWFLPSALVGVALLEPRFCFGALMAVRRAALEAIGGLAALAPYLADDFMLGRLVWQSGYQVRLAPLLVEHMTAEPDFKTLLLHELRWSRTIRACSPAGHAFSFISNNAIALGLALVLLPGDRLAGVVALAVAVILRAVLHFRVHSLLRLSGAGNLALLPVRDLLCLAVWAVSLWGRGITWNGQKFRLHENGRLSLEGVQSQ